MKNSDTPLGPKSQAGQIRKETYRICPEVNSEGRGVIYNLFLLFARKE